jgi:hypothetical protein
MLRALVIPIAAAALAAGCSTAPKPPPLPAQQACPVVAGHDPVEDAHELWIRIKTNAEKLAKLDAGDPNRGWLERSIDAEGRSLFTLLSNCAFDSHPVSRGAIRARLLFVVKPPTPEDRREAVQAVDQEFAALMKRRAGARASS